MDRSAPGHCGARPPIWALSTGPRGLAGCRQGGSPRQAARGRDRMPQPLPGPEALLSPPQGRPHQSHPTQIPTISIHALARLQGHQHRACRAASLWPRPPISKASSSLMFSHPPQRWRSTEGTVTEATVHGGTVHGGDGPQRPRSTEATVQRLRSTVHRGHGPRRPQSTEALGQTCVDKPGAPIPSENRDPRGAAIPRTRPRCHLTPDPTGCPLGRWDPPGPRPTNSFRETPLPSPAVP